MALIGKAQLRGNVGRCYSPGQQPACMGQAKLDQPRMRRQAKLCLEFARQAKAIDTERLRDIAQANILIKTIVQVRSGLQRQRLFLLRDSKRFSSVLMLSQGGKQLLHGGFLNDFQLPLLQALESVKGGVRQATIAGERSGEIQFEAVRHLAKDGPQLLAHKIGVDIQHAVGKSAVVDRITVMQFPRLKQKDRTRTALVFLPP
ncbi:hypothetical protein BIY28_18545 [Brenneria goodwinii]|nr:hypothetical protein BIY28_18545 [Brenneria goodwinii]